jgi:hypothetical protein
MARNDGIMECWNIGLWKKISFYMGGTKQRIKKDSRPFLSRFNQYSIFPSFHYSIGYQTSKTKHPGWRSEPPLLGQNSLLLGHLFQGLRSRFFNFLAIFFNQHFFNPWHGPAAADFSE